MKLIATRIFFSSLLFLFSAPLLLAQDGTTAPDTTAAVIEDAPEATTPQDSTGNNNTAVDEPSPADETPEPSAVDDKEETGVSISPSTLYFNAKLGTSQIKNIKIFNDTRTVKKFQIIFNDFKKLTESGGAGAKESPEYKYALSKWMATSATYIEVAPREQKTIAVTVTIPDDELAAISAWTMIVLEQVIDRPQLEIASAEKGKTVSMGIQQGISLGVFVYQNPPNIKNTLVDITLLKYEEATATTPNKILMEAKNVGDGIGFCKYYIELTSLITGKTDKLKVRGFTILPGYGRKVEFDLPKELASGKYSAVAVLDFGSRESLQTAELEFEIK